MSNCLIKKSLVFGIIVLFVVSVIPIINANKVILNTNNKEILKDSNFADTKCLSKCLVKNWTWIFYDDADFFNAYDPLIHDSPSFPCFPKEAYSSDNLNVIVLQDQEKGPASMWYINENHEKILLEEMGEINMGDYQILKDFIIYSKENYPAVRYLVSMYNHGGGWMGACWDDTNNGDHLTMDEMQKAYTETGGIDILCFTAPCNMGAVESAYELRDCVDIYIGDEEGSGYGHWRRTITNIRKMLNYNNSLTNIEIGQQIIQSIENNTPWPEFISMSAVRTDKTVELANAIDNLCQSLIENKDLSYSKFWSIKEEIQYFADGSLLDIYHLAEKYKTVETNQTICEYLDNVMVCLEEAVVEEFHDNEDHKNAHGLSIYFPLQKKYYYSYYGEDEYGLDFTKNTHWDEFLGKYMKTRTKSSSYPILMRFLELYPLLSHLLQRLTRL